MLSPRLLSWLAFLALLFAPLGMIGGTTGMAHASPAVAGLCDDSEKPAHAPPESPVDCMVACAGCLPALGGALAARPRPEKAAEPAPLDFRIRGLSPEAATPPPRFS